MLLRRVRRYGLLVIVVGFFGLALWSSFVAGRFSLTKDYAFYGQAWYLIAHGHLNPYSTLWPTSFWHNAFELVMWPLAPLWYLWPHAVTLLWVQDAAIAAIEAVLFVWMCEYTAVALRRDRARRWPSILPICGLVLLVASPWPIWISSFDFHPEAVDLLPAVIAAHAFWRGRNRLGWIASFVALLCGALGATYVAGIGIAAICVGRRWRRTGVVLVVVSGAWLLFIARIGGDQVAAIAYASLLRGLHYRSITTFSLFDGLLRHPSRAFTATWSVRQDVLANISSGGLIGILNPWSFGISLLVLLEGSLTGVPKYIQPYVQNSLPVVLLVPLGTILVCAALASSKVRWRRLVAGSIAGLAVLNVIGWSLVWTPRVESQYVKVSPGAAGVLAKIDASIPSNDEVIASQGVVGSFAFRKWIFSISTDPPITFPVHGTTVWFIIAPSQGIETESTVSADGQISQISAMSNSRLIRDAHGVFVFRWKPGTSSTRITFHRPTTVPAWTLNSTFARPVLSGSSSTWHLRTSGGNGLLLWGDYWRLRSGPITAELRYASTGPLVMQVWNVTSGQLISSSTVASTRGIIRSETLRTRFVNVPPTPAYAGFWPFVVLPIEPLSGDVLEVRVLNADHTKASIFSVGLGRSPTP